MQKMKQRLVIGARLREIALEVVILAVGLGITGVIFLASAFLMGVLLGLCPSLQAVGKGFWLFISAMIALTLIGGLVILDRRKWHLAVRLRTWPKRRN
jgi:hypothetical protein